MVVSTISHVDSNEDNANQAATQQLILWIRKFLKDVMFGKTALSHNESITTFLSCSHIRRRRVTTNEDDEFQIYGQHDAYTCSSLLSWKWTRLHERVRAIDPARLFVCYWRESDFDWSGLSFKSLSITSSHLRRGLDDVQIS